MNQFAYLSCEATSHIGHQRSTNEDTVLALPDYGVFCVADGMGGAACGDLASRWTSDAVREMVLNNPEPGTPRTARLRETLNVASRRIKVMADERDCAGCGTTAVVLDFDEDHARWASILHAGDSRAYRVRHGTLECLTVDHSIAAAQGIDNRADMPPAFRHAVTRAIGVRETIELEETPVEVEPDDVYLLCSDGLTNLVADRKLELILASARTDPLDLLAQQLVDAALDAGGDDNISVILIRVAPELPLSDALLEQGDLFDFSETSPYPDLPETAFVADLAESDEEAPSEQADTADDTADDTPEMTASDSTAMAEQVARNGLLAAAKTDTENMSLPQEAPESQEPAAQEPERPEPMTRAASPVPDAAARPSPLPESPAETEPPVDAPLEPPAATTPRSKRGPMAVVSAIIILVVILVATNNRRTDDANDVHVTPDAPYAPTRALHGEGVPVAEEPSPGETPALAVTTEQVARLQVEISKAADTALWGPVSRLIDEAEVPVESLREQVPNFNAAYLWVLAWRKARDDVDDAQAELERFAALTAPVMQTMAAPAPPPIRLSDLEDSLRADAYTVALLTEREARMKATSDYVRRIAGQLAVLGHRPGESLQRLAAAAGRPAPSASLAGIQAGLRQLSEWLAGKREEAVPRLGIMRGPVQQVPKLEIQREAFWETVGSLLRILATDSSAAEALLKSYETALDNGKPWPEAVDGSQFQQLIADVP